MNNPVFKKISIVIPLYNEQDNVSKLYAELFRVASFSDFDFEFIFVDDGSKDLTIENLKQCSIGDTRVKIVTFKKNFGQTAAIAAGLDYAEGDAVVTLDGDLQNDPAEIPRMLAKLEEGYDLVAGWRKNRQDKAISRKFPSYLANKLISKTTKVSLHDYGCTLKAMTRDIAKSIQLYGEMHRFIPALAAEQGARIAEIEVNHRPRIHGTSKYGISRTFRVLLDLLTVKFFLGFSTRPLHMFGFFGFISGFLGFAILSWLSVERILFAISIGGRPLLLLGVLLLIVGIQFLCFGLLAEILVRTYHESQSKKTYVVREVITSLSPKQDESKPKIVNE